MELIIEGSTVDTAINEGLKKLSKTRDEVKIHILEKGNQDFLGLTGSKPAKVKIIYNEAAFVSEAFSEEDEITGNEVEGIKKILVDWFEFADLKKPELKTEINGNNLKIEIFSEDSNIIIGKYGETLNAIQLLLNLIANKNREKNIHIDVDIENYRYKRKISLESLAEKYVSKLRGSRRRISLPPMNSRDRKIIHSYITKNHNVESVSSGQDPHRKIIFSLK